ncbi:MAG TPA: TRAP transporter small permease [Dehalococcoidia bacterium]|nr:TRAP transporter small permease [Dehalococcoidia bacterium]
MKILSTFRKVLAVINGSLVAVCGLAFFLYMFNIVADVTGRYLFLTPIDGTVHIGQLILPFATFLSLAYVQMRGEHIRVTLLVERLSPRWQAGLMLLTIIASIGLTALMARYGLVFAMRSFQMKEVATLFPMPLYIGKFAFFIGCALFSIQLIVDFLGQLFGQPATKNPEAGSSQ